MAIHSSSLSNISSSWKSQLWKVREGRERERERRRGRREEDGLKKGREFITMATIEAGKTFGNGFRKFRPKWLIQGQGEAEERRNEGRGPYLKWLIHKANTFRDFSATDSENSVRRNEGRRGKEREGGGRREGGKEGRREGGKRKRPIPKMANPQGQHF
jgi:hypothetical protein